MEIRIQLVGLKCWHGCQHIHCSPDHICEGYDPHTNHLMQKVLEGLSPFDDWKASCYFRHFQIIFIFLSLECLPLDVKILADLGPPHIHCCQVMSCCFIQCSMNQRHLSNVFDSKFRATHDVVVLGRWCLEIGIAYICCEHLQAI